jgi:hypothetical protein
MNLKSSLFLILRTKGSTILSCGNRLEWNFMLDKTIRKGEITWQMLTLFVLLSHLLGSIFECNVSLMVIV